MSAGSQLRPFSATDAHVLDHRLQLLFVDAGAHLGGGVEAVADFHRFHARDKFLDEFAVHALLYSHAAGGRAALSGGAEAAPDRAFDGEVEIGIIHHDDDVFSAHFQMALLERRRAGHADDAAYFGGASKADQIDVGMIQDRAARLRAVAEYHVEYAGRQARLRENLREIVSGKRRVLGGL